MQRKKIISFLIIGAFLVVGIASGVTYRVVQAQSTTQTPSTGPSTDASNPSVLGHGMKGAQYTQHDLANALNVTLEQLQAAEQSATTEALNQAVSAGLITQSQADQYSQNNPDGYFDGHLPFLKDSSIDYNSLLADALGIKATQVDQMSQPMMARAPINNPNCARLPGVTLRSRKPKRRQA